MTLVTPASHQVPVSAEEFGGMGPLVDRSFGIGRRLRRADRARPWVLDTAAVLLVVAMFCVPDLLHAVGAGEARGRFRIASTRLPVAELLVLQAGLVLPLLWRRRRPVAAFGAVTAVFTVQWALGAALRADIALFVALYSVALHGRARRLPWVCGVMAGAMVLAAVRVSAGVSVWDALFFLLSTATAALALGLMVRIRRAQLAGLRDRAARLEVERDQRSRLAAAAERARVAREMHDIVGHNLAVIITLADAGARVSGAGRSAGSGPAPQPAADVVREPAQEVLHIIGDTGRQALGELRRVLGVLREAADTPDGEPSLSPQPSLADIGVLCEGVRAAGLDVVYRTVGDTDALAGGVQLAVYRIVQEALTNALKHAGAGARVKLVVALTGTRLTIRVQDNGPPGTASACPRPVNEEGHGLVGMRERTALYGGRLSAGPAGRGWAVEAVLDIAAPEPAR